MLNDPRFPDRPQHPDFWRLSEILLKMDGRVTEEKDNNPDVFGEMVKAEFDLDSVMYMGRQRALRTANILTTGDPQRKPAPTNIPMNTIHQQLYLAAMMAYMEALLVGIEWERGKK